MSGCVVLYLKSMVVIEWDFDKLFLFYVYMEIFVKEIIIFYCVLMKYLLEILI